LAALEHRGPTKSPERAAYEQRLRTLHLLAESRTKEADEFVLKIAAGDSVQVGGHSVLLTAERLQGALASLDQAESRLDQLFARP
jgi:hypothetical protein